MSVRLSHRAPVVAAFAAAALAVPVASAYATAVGPDQFFTGTVISATSSGSAGSDVIVVDCSGPSSTGTPAPGQSVEVQLAAATGAAAGYTGSDATSIEADLIWSVANPPIVADVPLASLGAYATPEPIPTDIQVPCSGDGEVSFVPQPGGSDSVDYTLHITFVSTGV